MWVIPEDLGNFSPKKGEKSWRAKIHVFRRRIFAVELLLIDDKVCKNVPYLMLKVSLKSTVNHGFSQM
jgi:hypothetical protein